MDKVLKTIGWVIGTLATIYLGYLVNQSVPDVRYTLSEKIPVTFAQPGSSSVETIQQIEVKNVGNAEATRVLIKIDGNVSDYYLQKHSASDKPEIHNEQGRFEIIYPLLPPDAGLKLVFRSPDKDISLNISHDKGVATDALANKKLDWGLFVYILAFLLFTVWFLSEIRKISVGSWGTFHKYDQPQQYVQLTKPWYFFDAEWEKTRSKVLEEMLREKLYYSDRISDTVAYKLLNCDFRDTSDQWQNSVEVANKVLNGNIIEAVNSAINSSRVLEILRLQKPSLFSEEEWEKIYKVAVKQYKSLQMRETYGASSAVTKLKEQKPKEIPSEDWNDLISYWIGCILKSANSLRDSSSALEILRLPIPNLFLERDWNTIQREAIERYKAVQIRDAYLDSAVKSKIKEQRPKELPEGDWNELVSYWSNRYWENMLSDLLYSDEPVEFQKDIDLSLMTKQNKESLERWISRIIQLKKKEKKYQNLTKALKDIVEQRALEKNPPEEIEDVEWQRLLHYQEEFSQLSTLEEREKQNEEISRSLSKLESELLRDKEVIDKQLKFIDDLLRDPGAIDRVEIYDKTFSPRNFENIKTVASILKSNSK